MKRAEMRPISELCSLGNGHGFGPKTWSKSGLPIIRIQNLNGTNEYNYFDGSPSPDWIVETGDLLFAWAGTKGVSFGAFRWNGPRGVLNQHIFLIRPAPGINPDWLFYAMRLVTERIERKAHGFKSTLLHVRRSDVTGQEVLAPIEEEQREIARILNVSEKQISVIEHLLAASKRRRQGLMQKLLTGKRRFPGFSRPWKKMTIGAVSEECTIRNQNRLGPEAVRAVNKSEGMIPMKEHVMADNLSRYQVVRKHWFAYNPMRINIGSICQWMHDDEALVSPDYVVFKCREDVIDHRYFNAFRRSHMWSSFMDSAGAGGVRIRIYFDDLAQMPIPLPPLDEQRRIAQLFDIADREIELLERLLVAYHTQKKGLMQQLLTGKRRVKFKAA